MLSGLIVLVPLALLALLALVATAREVLRDGYRRVPSRVARAPRRGAPRTRTSRAPRGVARAAAR